MVIFHSHLLVWGIFWWLPDLLPFTSTISLRFRTAWSFLGDTASASFGWFISWKILSNMDLIDNFPNYKSPFVHIYVYIYKHLGICIYIYIRIRVGNVQLPNCHSWLGIYCWMVLGWYTHLRGRTNVGKSTVFTDFCETVPIETALKHHRNDKLCSKKPW